MPDVSASHRLTRECLWDGQRCRRSRSQKPGISPEAVEVQSFRHPAHSWQVVQICGCSRLSLAGRTPHASLPLLVPLGRTAATAFVFIMNVFGSIRHQSNTHLRACGPMVRYFAGVARPRRFCKATASKVRVPDELGIRQILCYQKCEVMVGSSPPAFGSFCAFCCLSSALAASRSSQV